jgi:GTP pyrophosphokinase
MYKQGADDDEYNKYSWIRELVSIFEDTKDAETAFKDTKINLHENRVFCFTPKGDVFNLTAGSTPIDFAYAIHSDVGNKCTGAKINGNIVQLKTKLKNGDEVEIITSKNSHPSEQWLNFVRTTKARTEIRQYVRLKRIDQYEEIGRKIIEEFFESEKLEVSDKMIEHIILKFGKKSVQELYAFIGEGLISKFEILKTLYPDHKLLKKDKEDIEKKILLSRSQSIAHNTKGKDNNSTPIEGLFSGVSITFARCCSPLPGDNISGVIKNGTGISIHKSDCKNFLNVEKVAPERVIPLKWKKEILQNKNIKFIAKLKIGIVNKPGNLAAVVNIFSSKNINVASIKTEEKNNGNSFVVFEIELNNVEMLEEIKSVLNASKSVVSVERI